MGDGFRSCIASDLDAIGYLVYIAQETLVGDDVYCQRAVEQELSK